MESVKYSIILIFASGIAFGVHYGTLIFLGLEPLANNIVLSYITNTVLAILIMIALIVAAPKLKGSLGFLFMGGSFLKFALFFAFFLPMYKTDGEMSKPEFFSFFVPYAVCLIFETKALVNKLSKE